MAGSMTRISGETMSRSCLALRASVHITEKKFASYSYISYSYIFLQVTSLPAEMCYNLEGNFGNQDLENDVIRHHSQTF